MKPSWMSSNKVSQVTRQLKKFGFRTKDARRLAEKADERGIVSVPETVKRIVMSQTRILKNPSGLVLIYDSITRVEGVKGKHSLYPGERFFHTFKRPYPAMYGTPDRKQLIIMKKR